MYYDILLYVFQACTVYSSLVLVLFKELSVHRSSVCMHRLPRCLLSSQPPHWWDWHLVPTSCLHEPANSAYSTNPQYIFLVLRSTSAINYAIVPLIIWYNVGLSVWVEWYKLICCTCWNTETDQFVHMIWSLVVQWRRDIVSSGHRKSIGLGS